MSISKSQRQSRWGCWRRLHNGASTAGDFYEIRRKVIQATSLSVGSVPLYQAFIEAARDSGSIVDMREDDSLELPKNSKTRHQLYGNSHGDKLDYAPKTQDSGRHAGLCSRGGPLCRPGWHTTRKKTRCLENLITSWNPQATRGHSQHGKRHARGRCARFYW